MAIMKSCISSPIEAGPSLLDSQSLPPRLTEAFEYISARLVRKRTHLSLIIVPDGTQLPLAPTSPLDPQSQTLAPHTSFFSRALSPIQCHSPSSPRSPLTPSSPFLSPRSPRSPRSLFSSGFSLFTQSLPSTPRTPTSPFARPQSLASTSTLTSSASSSTSATLSTTSSTTSPSSSTPSSSAATPPTTDLTLLLASPLTPKASRILTTTLRKASHKYTLAISTPPTPPSPLLHRSILQNSALLATEGLTLLRLDRIYTLKLALSAYSRLLGAATTGATATMGAAEATGAAEPLAAALATAIDELRLLLLSQRGRPLATAYLSRAYDHLPVAPAALREVNRTYLAHFGSSGAGGGPPITGVEEGRGGRGLVVVVPQVPPPRRRRGSAQSRRSVDTVRCSSRGTGTGTYARGPVTPGGWEDITPITRGEWSFFVGGGLPKIGAVEAW